MAPTQDRAPTEELAKMSVKADSTIQCGEEAKQEFAFARGYLNLNHGSFGAVPASIHRLQKEYQDASQLRPDIFLRYTFPPLLSPARQAIADYLSCEKSSVVFVPNATTALNTVLRNLVYGEGDVAFYFSTIYTAIEKTLMYLSESTPLQLHSIQITQPLSNQAVLDAFEDAIDQCRKSGKKPRLAVFDTISSMPGVRWPFETLVQACKSHGILSVIDGAHSIGQLPIDLPKLDPDFYTSNCHKWLYVPRPCAIILPTSHGFVPSGKTTMNTPLPRSDELLTEFEANFEFVGTLDSTAYLCVPAALEWRKRVRWADKVGDDAIFAYIQNQAREAGQLVSKVLQTEVMENAEDTLQNCAFTMVRLPLSYSSLTGEITVDAAKVMQIARAAEKALVNEHDTFIAIIFHGGHWWVRLSAQIYLTIDDWKNAAGWLKDVCERIRGGSIPY